MEVELLNILQIGHTKKLVGFDQLTLNQINISTISDIFRKACLIQLIAHYGGINSMSLEKMDITQLKLMYQCKLKMEYLQQNLEKLFPQLFFMSNADNYIMRCRDKKILSEFTIPEMISQIKLFEVILKEPIRLPYQESLLRIPLIKWGILKNNNKILADKLKNIIITYSSNYPQLQNYFISFPLDKWICKSSMKPLDEMTNSEILEILPNIEITDSFLLMRIKNILNIKDF